MNPYAADPNFASPFAMQQAAGGMPPGGLPPGMAPQGMAGGFPPGAMPNQGGRGGGLGGPRRGPDGAQKQQVPRNNEIGDASRVIHCRNVTPEVSQLSIQNLVQSFGRIKNIVMLRQKNQALVEMESLQSAQQLVDFFKDPGYAEIDGRRVYIRYSLHQELTATQTTSKTLLVSMFNTQYDVSSHAQITPSIVYQIFGNYGTVEKIVVLPKNESSASNHNRVQSLVQFETKEVAESVKNMLQGQPVTLGESVSFTLDIQFSRMDEIKTSSPHNSLVIPKGTTPQQQQHMAMQQQLSAMQMQMLMQQQQQQALMGGGAGAAASVPAGVAQAPGQPQQQQQPRQDQRGAGGDMWN